MRLRLTHNSSGLSLNGIAIFRELSGLIDRATARRLVDAGHIQEHEFKPGLPARMPHVKQCEVCQTYFLGPATSKACSCECSKVLANRREEHKRQESKSRHVRQLATSCAICLKPMVSVRASKLTCSPKCRQAAYRKWVKS